MKYYKYFAWFIWVGFGITYFIHNLHLYPKDELAVTSIAMTLVLYIFVNYVYASVIMDAITSRNNLVFIAKTLMMSAVEATSIVAICNMLEGFKIFNITSITGFLTDAFTFTLVDWLAMFFITIIMNFGFYGLEFFQKNLELQKSLADSQLQALQAQITPHFMFNVLNYVNVMMSKDTDLASDLLVKYSEILRYQLYSSKNKLNALTEEVDFLKKFIDIEQLRWADKLDVECRWEVKDKSFKLSPLLLIVLVENAFKHVSRSTTNKGYIKINLTEGDNELTLTIENSTIPIENNTSKSKSKGIGLTNLRERLRILYPDRHKLLIDKQPNTYTTTLKLKGE